MNHSVNPHVRKSERIPPHVKRHKARLNLIKQLDSAVKHIVAQQKSFQRDYQQTV